jgi:uncharacterized protein
MLKLLAMIGMLAAPQAARDPHMPAPVVDTVAPKLPANVRRDAVLIVSKTNGWRHLEHIPHSNEVLAGIAKELGHASFTTENAAVFDDKLLSRFSVVVLNSASGDFMTPAQRAAFERFVARGGGVVALHAAGDNSHKAPWYFNTFLGATFTGHPNGPDHIQKASVVVREPQHPVMAGITQPWTPADEWYSFDVNPATKGMKILATIDEASYRPGPRLTMGAEHPIVWTNPNVKARVVYSAMGHNPENYDDPNARRFLTNAIRWAAGGSATR